MSALDRQPGARGSLLSGTVVSEAMRAGIVECPPDAGVTEIARLLAEHGIHCVVVAGIERRDDSDERLAWGIVSDLDLIAALTSGAEEASAAQLAATAIVTVESTDSLEQAAELMAARNAHHLVVVSSAEARPVGVISTLDIARAAAAAGSRGS